MLIVKDIIKSQYAIYHEEGISLYEQLQKLLKTDNAITISFDGVTRCSTQFLNAAIGNLYLNNEKAKIEGKIKILGNDELQRKIADVKDNALHSKDYNQFVENASA